MAPIAIPTSSFVVSVKLWDTLEAALETSDEAASYTDATAEVTPRLTSEGGGECIGSGRWG